MKFNIGDKVTASFPNSALTIGGTVLMVIAVNGKEPEYTVFFDGIGTHNSFPESLLKS